MESEEAPLELQFTEDETYSRADIRDYDSPEIRKIKKVQQVNSRAKFEEVDERNYTSYDE